MTVDLNGADALLLVGDSERHTDLYYATRFRAPGAFIFLWTPQSKIAVMSDLELDRAKAQAQVDQVLAHSALVEELRRQGQEQPAQHQVLLAVLRQLGLRRLLVPADFPFGLADQLRQGGIELQAGPAPLFPQRQIKSAEELQAIRRSLRAAELGMEVAVAALRRSQIGADQVLYTEGQVLTAQRLRQLIHHHLLDEECSAQRTIVACGEQGCDPHQEGSGPLRAGQTLILDIFPQSATSGYFGDITRTVVKGRAPALVQRLYETVRQGQQLAIGQICAGAEGGAIHKAVQDYFTAQGYTTGEEDGQLQGFFHSTGHGLGLDIHESPRIGPRAPALQAGQVVTVEPGLYYRRLGAVRLEDVVLVGEGGCQLLTSYPKFLEIP
ncbi:MAG: aminopeptidase P family protein [Candidatus Handelsmanbacteria bacterium]|nr:aminopeptidase P family protein [Candidatus Handelsmanbacteria bacterium]